MAGNKDAITVSIAGGQNHSEFPKLDIQ